MVLFTSKKPTETLEEEEAEMTPKLETFVNPLENSFSSSSDWYLGSNPMSWSGSYGSNDEFGMLDWANLIPDDSSLDEEFPVNIASVPVGFVLSVKGKKVIVEGKENINLLKGSFLWVSETRAPLGCVDKVFGTVKKPCFRVRLQVGQGIEEGAEVSIIVEDFVQQEKDCDASFGDVVDEVQLSDDDIVADWKLMQTYVLAFENIDFEVSPLKSQGIAETGGLVPQEQPLPRMGKFVVPRRSESTTNQQKGYQPPMANKMGGITPKPVSTEALVWTALTPCPTTYTQPRYMRGQNHNNQQPFGGMQKSYQNQQNQAPVQAQIRPVMNIFQHDQPFPNLELALGQHPMARPMMNNYQQNQAFPYGQAPMRPVMYNNQHDQAFPDLDLALGQPPVTRPMAINENQNQGEAPNNHNYDVDQLVPILVPSQAPMIRPVTNNQNNPVANQMVYQDPMQPPFPLAPNHTYNPRPEFLAFRNPQAHLNVHGFTRVQYPYLRPEDNHQNLDMPLFNDDQVFTITSPSGELRSYVVLPDPVNTLQYCVMSLNDAVVIGPWPQPQLRPPMQPPMQP